LFLAPSADKVDQQEPMIIGQVSANRVHEIAEHYPHLKTKYSHAVLCIWKPSISTVHAFVARNLRWCLTSGCKEGGEALRTLKEVGSPEFMVEVLRASTINSGEPSAVKTWDALSSAFIRCQHPHCDFSTTLLRGFSLPEIT
jgi:hypothetical protein